MLDPISRPENFLLSIRDSLKRAIDIVGSGLVLLVSSPLLFAVAAAIAVETGFPILYRQKRVGRGFKQFGLLKLRSMTVDGAGLPITASGDKRVTRVGRFLRTTRLDEFPQFWNVLCGDMSLVGPRPEIPLYVEMFRDRYARILSVRPGITDFASIRFRDEEGLLGLSPDPQREYVERILPAKLALADEYIEKRSATIDLLILLKTLAAIFRAA